MEPTRTPTDAEDFYAELVVRNRGLVSPEEQAALRRTRFVIAGCGSTGGACVMPLVRSGAERFVLLDPGDYELNNLNRQDATLGDVGANKARATARRVHRVNPHAAVQVHEQGVVPGEIEAVLATGDVVVDAVDVTTLEGVRAKVALHEAACGKRLPVVTAYDIAGTQFIELYDYRVVDRPLRGRVREPVSPEGVLKSLVPPLAVPREIFAELLARRREPGRPFPQLAMTSTLLGAIAVPYLLRVILRRPVRTRVRIDLNQCVRPPLRRLVERVRRDFELVGMWWRLR